MLRLSYDQSPLLNHMSKLIVPFLKINQIQNMVLTSLDHIEYIKGMISPYSAQIYYNPDYN